MPEYIVKEKTFIKSSSNSSKILFRYSIALIIYLIYILFCIFIKKDYSMGIKLMITFLISLIITSVIQYIINIKRKRKNFLLVFKEDNVIASSIIISLFCYKEKILIVIISSIISEIIKLFNKNIGLSSSLYGILFIIIYKMITGTYVENIILNEPLKLALGLTFQNTSPIISIITLIYLFHKKSIKYPIIFSYLLTYIILVSLYSILSSSGTTYIIKNILASNTIFLGVLTLTDYKISPISFEGGIIYGILASTLTFIIGFFNIDLAPVITFILMPLLLTKFIDKISFKLKYNKKFNRVMQISSISISLVSLIIFIILK